MTGQSNFIPFNGVKRQYENLRWELADEIANVMATGNLLNGHKKAIFEDQIACRVGREYAICVNSGTNALHYIFDWIAHCKRCAGWKAAEQMNIALPNYSFRATQNSIADRGIARYVDVDGMSGLMDFKSDIFTTYPLDVIMYVNLFGNMVNYEELATVTNLFSKNQDSIIIEDAAQSFGATFKGKPSGSFGDFSILAVIYTGKLIVATV